MPGKQRLAGPPPLQASGGGPSGDAPLCLPTWVAHASSYYTRPAGAWITSDMNWRLIQAGLVGASGVGGLLKLPALPNGPAASWLQPYSANTACSWDFSTPPGAVTYLNISYLNTQQADLVRVLDMTTAGKPKQLYSFSGKIKKPQHEEPIQLTANRFRVRFTSDGSDQAVGFLMRYRVTRG